MAKPPAKGTHDHGADIRAYLGRDLASTHAQPDNPIENDALAPAAIERLHRDGFLILEGFLSPAEVDEVNGALAPIFDKPGRSGIEGYKTRRIYNMLSKTRACDRMVDHPTVLALLAEVLAPNPLLSQLQGISVEDGERPQPLHTDDLIYPGARPRQCLSAATIFALDDFSEKNGATVLYPGSHTWGERPPSDEDTRVVAHMPAGSLVFLYGSLWHGAGGNQTQSARRAVSAQYCQPWLRTQENLALATPRSVARELSPEIQRLLGYQIHPPFMGMVDGLHPKRLLED